MRRKFLAAAVTTMRSSTKRKTKKKFPSTVCPKRESPARSLITCWAHLWQQPACSRSGSEKKKKAP